MTKFDDKLQLALGFRVMGATGRSGDSGEVGSIGPLKTATAALSSGLLPWGPGCQLWFFKKGLKLCFYVTFHSFKLFAH